MLNGLFFLILVIILAVGLIFTWFWSKKARLWWWILVTLYTSISLSLAIIGLASSTLPVIKPITTPNTTAPHCYLVDRVVDGDTFKVWQNGKSVTVRLIGIDTPESVDPRQEVQCFGKEASEYTKKLLEYKQVCLVADPKIGEFDKYQRLLVYAYRQSDQLFINEHLVSQGYAHEYTYGPIYKHQNDFREAESKAKEQKLGLWAEGVCDDFKDRKSPFEKFELIKLILEELKKR